ncbi:MAG: hypothetical protein GX149_06095 [Acholeplasmataceae bacterium]|nr:hypothetical protein [Acholeplasmataceae bacterium]
MNLTKFLDNELEDDVMDVIIKKTDGSFLLEPNYEDYLVKEVKYVKNTHKKAHIIVVRIDEAR